MFSEIKLTVAKNGKIIQTISKEIEGNNLVNSLSDFQLLANGTLTNIIADISHDSGDVNMDEEEDASDSEENNEQLSPKKKKKVDYD